ncbi:phosphatase PAP2 family protein [Aquirufa sp. 5-AUSEE-100C1]
MKNRILILFLLLVSISSQAQKKAWAYAAGLSGISILLYNDASKEAQKKYYDSNLSNFHTSADNILQYSPTLLNIGLHLAGLEDKSSKKELLGKFIIGTSTYVVIAQGLKYGINETRPDGTERSFPSGHTTTAFFGARMLDKAYGKKYPAIAVGGYALASATGAFRMANNKHWATDIFMGAAIGIASAEIADWAYPKFKKVMNKTAVEWEPIVAPNYYAARLSYTF